MRLVSSQLSRVSSAWHRLHTNSTSLTPAPLSLSLSLSLTEGTPGCGKSSLCEALASALGFQHVEVNSIITGKELHSGRDAAFDSLVVDEDAEDKICDEMEPYMGTADGGKLVDYHSGTFFPERWFDLVIVLRCDNTTLYDRLVKRGYSQKKLTENVECEIMQVVLESVRESYQAEIIKELQSNSMEDLDRNVDAVSQWAAAFR